MSRLQWRKKKPDTGAVVAGASLELGSGNCLIEDARGGRPRWTYAGGDAQWRPFTDQHMVELEKAFAKGASTVELRLTESMWTIDLKSMSMIQCAATTYSSLNRLPYPVARSFVA